jgi:hypothetical protein
MKGKGPRIGHGPVPEPGGGSSDTLRYQADIYTMLSMTDIAALHDRLTGRWHQEALETWQLPEDSWTSLVSRQHLANFELWHTEDAARTPGATDADLARVKRRIDETNQRRNDLSEQIDQSLLDDLAKRGLPNAEAPLHSESPGLMIDRLSILALKIFHTREEMERADAPAGHIARNRDRLAVLIEQRDDLAECLATLWRKTLSGTRRFKLYRQLKMYNDPSLNPAVYRNPEKAERR